MGWIKSRPIGSKRLRPGRRRQGAEDHPSRQRPSGKVTLWRHLRRFGGGSPSSSRDNHAQQKRSQQRAKRCLPCRVRQNVQRHARPARFLYRVADPFCCRSGGFGRPGADRRINIIRRIRWNRVFVSHAVTPGFLNGANDGGTKLFLDRDAVERQTTEPLA
jgi:hypothetical protein